MIVSKEKTGVIRVHPFPTTEPHAFVELRRLPSITTDKIYDKHGFFPNSKRGEKMEKLSAAVREIVGREIGSWGNDPCDCVEARGAKMSCGFWDGDRPLSEGGFAPLDLNDENKQKFIDTRVKVDGEEMAVYTRIDQCVKEKLGVQEGN